MDTKTIFDGELRLDGEEILLRNESGNYDPLPQKAYLLGFWHDGMRAVRLECGDSMRWGYFIENSNDIIPPLYKEALSFQEGLAPVCVCDNGLWGFIDKKNGFWYTVTRIVAHCDHARFISFQKIQHRGLSVERSQTSDLL